MTKQQEAQQLMLALATMDGVDLLGGLSTPHLDRLASIKREFGFRPGEYLFRLGDDVETIFVIRTGSVQLTIPLEVGAAKKEVVVEELSAGNCLAWSAVIAPHRSTTSARATTQSELVGFSRQDLLEIFEVAPGLGWRMMTNLAQIIGGRLQVTNAMLVRELQRPLEDKFG